MSDDLTRQRHHLEYKLRIMSSYHATMVAFHDTLWWHLRVAIIVGAVLCAFFVAMGWQRTAFCLLVLCVCLHFGNPSYRTGLHSTLRQRFLSILGRSMLAGTGTTADDAVRTGEGKEHTVSLDTRQRHLAPVMDVGIVPSHIMDVVLLPTRKDWKPC